jgi:phytoene dehydrogenase-like protein
MGAISESIAAAARELGADVRTDSPIAEVAVGDNGVKGVVTEDGRSYESQLVVSNVDAKTLYLKMVGQRHLPSEVVREISTYRTFSTAFKMNIACERPPQYTCLQRAIRDDALAGWSYPTYVHIGPDIDYLERAYDDAKYGSYSKSPFITPVCPTIVDTTLAPEGKHVVNLFGGHAPYQLKNADWNQEKARFEKIVLQTLERFAPGFCNDVIANQFLIAPDIERIVGLPQGHIFQGELSVDQLFFQRPVPHFADYRTPIKGLYLCGGSVHPGGGVSGIPGYNAAREVLRDLGKQSTLRFAD